MVKNNYIIFDTARTQYNISKYRILQKNGFKCYYCGINLTVSKTQKEHFVARSKGGLNGVKSGNIVPSCFNCNMKKGNKDIEKFRIKLFGKRNKNNLFHFEKLGEEK